jgi:hypothetical protein
MANQFGKQGKPQSPEATKKAGNQHQGQRPEGHQPGKSAAPEAQKSSWEQRETGNANGKKEE